MSANIVKKYRNRTNCSVFGCHSLQERDRQLSFHRMPKRHELKVTIKSKLDGNLLMDKRKAWEYVLGYGKKVTDSMRVCSLHFTRDDYILPDFPSKSKRLKKTAVPSVNLPIVRKDNKMAAVRSKNLSKRSQKPVSILSDVAGTSNIAISADNTIMSEETAAEVLLSLGITDYPDKKDCSVQVNSGDLRSPFYLKLVTDKHVSTATGVPNMKILDMFVCNLSKLHISDRISSVLTLKDKLVLTLMKMKQDLSYSMLSILFGITPVTCRRIFQIIIQELAAILKYAIDFPSKEKISENLPISFKESFSDVRVVLDCTEITVQKPSCLCCRIRTYSHYKGNHTIKYMTGVAPSGLITFVSDGYGGRSSDKAIFEQSNIIRKLTSYEDSIMVDKGFLIDEITSKNNIKLIRPPFLRNSKQFTKEEADLTRKIAAARVHIERSNARIKMFKILNSKLPWSLAPYCDDIFTTICGIVNLSAPIIADTGF